MKDTGKKQFIKRIAVIALAVIIGFSTAACDDSDSDGGNDSGNSGISVTLSSVSADGSSLYTTTKLVLAFDKEISGLTEKNITLNGMSGVSKGTLSGSNPYTLPISGFTSSGALNVAVSKSGYKIKDSPMSVSIYYNSGNNNNNNNNNNITANLNSVTADGSSTWTTTQLVLSFDKAISGLTAADITLNGVSGVSKGTLSGSNPYTLPVSGFTSSGTLSVAVAKSGYTINGSPKPVDIYFSSGNSNNTTAALNSVTADGSLTKPTTQLTLLFDREIPGFTANDITLSGVSGVSKGTLSGYNPYTLPVSGFTSSGNLNVTVSKSGYEINNSPKTVSIYYCSPFTLNSVTADGSSSQTTTQLVLAFDKAISGLTAADITLSGVNNVSKGTLSGSNPYTLPISGFTSSGTLNIEVLKSGYEINDSPKTVSIYYCSPFTLNSVTANGSSTQTTTQLTLLFDREFPELTAADIILSGVNNVNKGALSGSNPYTLPVSGFTSNGTLNVAVSKSGYVINDSQKTANIYYCVPVTLNSVTANGSSSQTTTQLTLTFDKTISGLSAADITLSGVSGVSKGTLNGYNPYTLPVSGFTSSGTLNIVVSKSGYVINGSPKTVGIYYSSGNGNSSVLTYKGYIDSPSYKEYKLTITSNTSFELKVDSKISSGMAAQNGNQFQWTLSPQAGAPFTVQLSSAGIVQISGIITFNDGSYEAGPGMLTPGKIDIAVEMIQIPGGSFEMGNPDTSIGRDDERPVHTVTLSSFYMGKYEVTQNQWTAVMGNNPSYFPDSPATGEVQGKRPVDCLSWYDTLVFCNKLSMMEGLSPAYRISGSTDPADWGTVPDSENKAAWDAVDIVAGSNGYRLPTEAQWEYAARGGNWSPGNYTYSGSNTIGDVAWYRDNSGDKTHEVGKKAPNGLGLYDMTGNVLEWCWDWYDEDYYSSSPANDPMGAAAGSYRVVRGGSWRYDAYSASHRSYDDTSGSRSSGFRLVRP